MDDRLHFPGLSNSWTMPVENRLDMELTGIKTPVGLKIQGPDVDRIQQIGSQIEEILGSVPGTRGIFAERVSQGFYINIDVDRAAAARYGLTVGDVQRAVSSGMGGENIATTVEGRERYPINVRYLADYRNDLNALRRILIMTPSGAQIPLGEVARIDLSPGPSMIRDEDGRLTGYVYVDLATSDYGSYVDNAQRVLDRAAASARRIHPQMVGRVRVPAARAQAPDGHPADRFRPDLCPALHAVPVGDRSDRTDSSDRVCDDRRAAASVHDGLQLQRRRVGRLHRAVRNRGRNRRRDGDLSSRSAESSHRRRRTHSSRTSRRRSSKVRSSGFDPS